MYWFNKGDFKFQVIESVRDIAEYLPTKLKDRFNYWLENYKEKEAYCCIHFLYYLVSGKNLVRKKWTPIYSENKTSVVFFKSSKNSKNYHISYYLPNIDKYLSQFGNGGLIILCNKEDIINFYETDQIFYLESIDG